MHSQQQPGVLLIKESERLARTQQHKLSRDRDREREGRKGLGCSPNHMAPSIMNCMRDQPHEADGTSTVDQVYAPLHLAPGKIEQFNSLINNSDSMYRNAEKKQKAIFFLLRNWDFGAPRKEAKIVHPGRQMRSVTARAPQNHPFHYSLGRTDGRPLNYETTAQNGNRSRRLSAPPMASSRAKFAASQA